MVLVSGIHSPLYFQPHPGVRGVAWVELSTVIKNNQQNQPKTCRCPDTSTAKHGEKPTGTAAGQEHEHLQYMKSCTNCSSVLLVFPHLGRSRTAQAQIRSKRRVKRSPSGRALMSTVGGDLEGRCCRGVSPGLSPHPENSHPRMGSCPVPRPAPQGTPQNILLHLWWWV